MGLFRCSTCGSPSDQAAECAACGARTFILGRDPRMTAGSAGRSRDQRRGVLVSISDAPSLRRRRARAAAMRQ